MKPTGAIIVDDHEDSEITQEGLDRTNRKIQATIKKRTEPKPEFVPPPPLEKFGPSLPDNESGLFGRCLLHMAAIVSCAMVVCAILQKLSH